MTTQRSYFTRIFLVLLLFMQNSKVTTAQNLDSLHHLILEQYDATLNFSIEYSANDFYLNLKEKDEKDERSYEQIQILKDSLELTGNKVYLVRIGQLYNRLNERTKSKEWLLKALAEYSKAYVLDPNSYKLNEEMIGLHMEMGQTNKAIEKLNKLLEIEPDDLDQVFLNTMLHMMLGKYDDAITIIDDATVNHPKDPGLILMKTMNDVFKLIVAITLETNIEKAEKLWDNYSLNGTYLAETKATYSDDIPVQVVVTCSELFILFYGEVIPLMFNLPDHDDLVGYRFDLSDDERVKLKNIEQTLKSFIKKKVTKNTYALHYSLGIVHMLRSDYKKAIPYFKYAIEQKSDKYRNSKDKVVSCYDNIIAAHLFLDDKKSAEKTLQKKIDEHANGDPSALDHLQLAKVKLKNHDTESAKILLETALRLDSSNVDIYTVLADLFIVTGDLEKANQLLDQAYEISPDDPGLFSSLIALFISRGDLETASFMVEKFLAYDPEHKFSLAIKRCYLDTSPDIEK